MSKAEYALIAQKLFQETYEQVAPAYDDPDGLVALAETYVKGYRRIKTFKDIDQERLEYAYLDEVERQAEARDILIKDQGMR